MKVIKDKIVKECKKAKELRERAWHLPMDEAIKTREEQNKTFKKFEWLKELNKAMEKEKNEKNN